jgi:O-acetylhomoserine/O-acetylserine sulfhydrylase-like pyridoxal-dependent enzyme
MAAQFLVFQTICEMGDNIISTSYLYGGTYNQVRTKLHLQTSFQTVTRDEFRTA